MAIMQEVTRHGRRHKSVGGGSMTVDEATTTVFHGSTRGSKHNDYFIKNRDEWHCQNWAPSVVSQTFIKKRFVSPGDSKTIAHRPSMTSICVHRQGKHHVPMIASSGLCHDVFEKAMRGDTDQKSVVDGDIDDGF